MKGKGGKEENVRVNKDISARVSLYTKTHVTAMRTENLGLGGLQSEGGGGTMMRTGGGMYLQSILGNRQKIF